MGKLKLDLDALAVESFETTRAGESEGTVHGNQQGGGITALSCFHVTCNVSCFATCHVSCFQTCAQTCPLRPSCGPTCHVSCFASCHGSCFQTCHATCFVSCQHTCIHQICGAVVSGGVPCDPHLPPLHTPVINTINQG